MKNSAIQWTDHTFNSWQGCTKVAPECKNCYAEVLVDQRFGRAKWGKGQPRARTSQSYWSQPIGWNVAGACEFCDELSIAEQIGLQCENCYRGKVRRQRVFCLSLGDWLDDEVPIEWLADLLALIHATPNLDWQLLTKRPQNWKERIAGVSISRSDKTDDDFTGWLNLWYLGKLFPPNIWIGVSAGADQRAALDIPAKIHFLSCEPMLHEFDTTHAAGFDWIIFGGESGKNARFCNVDWIREGIEFCRRNKIACFVKQLGAVVVAGEMEPTGKFRTNPETGKRQLQLKAQVLKLHDSHGGDWNEWPADLRVREFPA